MKLSYRGVSYDYQPPVVETVEGKVGGQYRGRDWRFRNLEKSPVLLPTRNLTYRGVTYCKPETISTNVIESEKKPTISTQEKARSLMLNHARAVKIRQQAMLSRSIEAISSSAVASTYWNRIQGKIHPTFRKNYARFGAAMS